MKFLITISPQLAHGSIALISSFNALLPSFIAFIILIFAFRQGVIFGIVDSWLEFRIFQKTYCIEFLFLPAWPFPMTVVIQSKNSLAPFF